MDDFLWLQKYYPNNGKATNQEEYPEGKILETRLNKADGTVLWKRLRGFSSYAFIRAFIYKDLQFCLLSIR